MSKEMERALQDQRDYEVEQQGEVRSAKKKKEEWPKLYDPATLSRKARKWNFVLR